MSVPVCVGGEECFALRVMLCGCALARSFHPITRFAKFPFLGCAKFSQAVQTGLKLQIFGFTVRGPGQLIPCNSVTRTSSGITQVLALDLPSEDRLFTTPRVVWRLWSSRVIHLSSPKVVASRITTAFPLRSTALNTSAESISQLDWSITCILWL